MSDTRLRILKPYDKVCKIAGALGLYVTVTPLVPKSFRYDFRLDGKRATLTVGCYADGTPTRAGK